MSLPDDKIYYFIMNHNRLDVLKIQVESLRYHQEDIEMVIIVDHNSTYQPLLDYYQSIEGDSWIKVERIRDQYYGKINVSDVNLARVGFKNLVRLTKEYYQKYKFNYFGKSDPDCEIPKTKHYFRHLINISKHHGDDFQIGGALRIDDIPDEYPLKEDILKLERRFWVKSLEHHENINGHDYILYKPTAIDGTPAIFSSKFIPVYHEIFCYFKSIRVAGDFQIKHLDWYIYEPNEELINYRKTSGTKASHSMNWILGLEYFPLDEKIIQRINEMDQNNQTN